jgi:hypothetical protein
MPGFIVVDAAAIADDTALARWIDAGTGYASWMSPKATRSTNQSTTHPTSAVPSTRTSTAGRTWQRLTFPWIGERSLHRGSGGHKPLGERIASAIRASGL